MFMSESPVMKARLEFESDTEFTFPLATNMVVNFDSEHFYIRFYQASPPTIFGDNMPESVKAKLIAGIAVPASRIDGIIKALQENYSARLHLEDELAADLDYYTNDELEDLDGDDKFQNISSS